MTEEPERLEESVNPFEGVENTTRRNVSPELEALIGKKFPVLSDGFLRVVSYMGTEASIVQAARCSYGAGTKKVSEDRGLLRYLLRHNHCYDAETEVLTDRGFVPWPLVTVKDRVGAWDEKKQTLIYEIPKSLVDQAYDGEMWRINHGGVDLLVTPEHKMWVKTKVWSEGRMEWSSSWRLEEAQSLGNRSTVRYSKLAPLQTDSRYSGSDTDDHCSFLELVGFFVGDGHAQPDKGFNEIKFHLRKQQKIDYLRELCCAAGLDLKDRANDTYTINSPDIGKSFRLQFYNEDSEKKLPDWVMGLGQEDAALVLLGLRRSDGSEKRGAWSYSTTSNQLAGQFPILALHAGEAVNEGAPNLKEDLPKSKSLRRFMVLSRMREPVINQGRRNTTVEHYNGRIYCAETSTGVIVVRRNGKIVLSGNSTPLEMCSLKLHVRVPMDAWRQWVRHRSFSINEYSTRYSDAINSQDTTKPDEWRKQGKGNKQGSFGVVTEFPENYKEGDTSPESPGQYLSRMEESFQIKAREVYDERIEFGVSREVARKDLPLSTYTEAYWTGNLRNLLHFLGLRMDSHAQKEIRDYADIIGNEMVAKWVPNVWEAFNDYHSLREAITFTALEVNALRLRNESASAGLVFEEFPRAFLPEGWKKEKKDGTLRRNRERDEFSVKLKSIGITPGF